MNTLEVINVSKKFKRKTVLENVNLSFKSGNIYGLVGENGSGKTVLMKIMIGFMRTQSGKILYNGKELKKDFDYLPSVSFIIETPEFYDELTGFENLKLLAEINNKISDEEINGWMEIFKLENDSKKIKDYSLGMEQRLGLIQALMEDPEVLILDEFSNSLDEEGVLLTHDILKKEKEKGKIIIISSHYKYDIENLADEIYRIKDGKIIHEK